MDINFEEMSNGRYSVTNHEFNSSNAEQGIWTISGSKDEEEKIHTYDEAIDLTGDNVKLDYTMSRIPPRADMVTFGHFCSLTPFVDFALFNRVIRRILFIPDNGNGWYNISLLIALAVAVQGMALDMFGFTYVVAAARCDLQMSHNQTSFLLSVPLIGAITSAYLHGYMTDTRGRKKCLSVVLWGSFLVALLSALSPSFVVLAIFKFISSSMSSGIQPMAYTLLGESCSVRTKGSYMLILTSSLVCGYAVFTTHAYLVLGLDFTYDLGFITLKPWRLLIVTLAMALGFSAVLLCFFYESPKYLINAGRTSEALGILRKIKLRNRGDGNYPVKKIILLEKNTSPKDDVSFFKSLLDQTVPLFKPPLLQRTLILFYITFAIYSVNNGFFLWIPILTRTFFEESSTLTNNVTGNFCNLLNSRRESDAEKHNCSTVVSLETFLMSIIEGAIFLVINFGVSVLSHKKKAMIVGITVFSSFCCFAMLFITEKFTTIVAFFGVQTNSFIMGIVFCYFVELYPTRLRGMISCLGVMVARISGMAGVQLVGLYTFTHCRASLYAWGAYILSGALIAFLLPSDTHKKS